MDDKPRKKTEVERETTSKERALVQNTLIISIGSAGASVLKMLNVLLFTHFVTVDQVGDYDVVTVYVSLLAPLAMLALNEAVYRWLLDTGQDKRESFTTSLVMMMLSVTVFDIAALIILRITGYQYTVELLALIATTAIYTFSQFVTRGLKNNRTYALQGIVFSIVLLSSNVLLVAVISLGARGLLWSMVIANVLATVYVCIAQHVLRNYLSKEAFDEKLVRPFLVYSIPIVPNNIAWWLVSASNRIIISMVLGSAANGIYAISNRFPNVLSMVTTFFYQAWQEQAITEYSSDERDAYYSRVFNAYVLLLLGAVLVLLPISKLVIDLLVESSFATSSEYLGPLYLSSVFNAMAAFYGTGYLSTRKTIGALVTTFAGAGINAACSIFLLPIIGLQAAALGSMLGNLAIWLLRVLQTRNFYSITIKMPSLFVGVLLCAIFSVIVPRLGIWQLLALEVLGMALFGVMNRKLVMKGARVLQRRFGGM